MFFFLHVLVGWSGRSWHRHLVGHRPALVPGAHQTQPQRKGSGNGPAFVIVSSAFDSLVLGVGWWAVTLRPRDPRDGW